MAGKRMTNINGMIEKNQAFNSALNTQRQYATKEQIGINPDGTPIYRSRALYEPVSNGFGYNTAYTPNLNIQFQNLPTAPDKEDYLNEYAKAFEKMGLKPTSADLSNYLRTINSAKSLSGLNLNSDNPGNSIPNHRMGGFKKRSLRKLS